MAALLWRIDGGLHNNGLALAVMGVCLMNFGSAGIYAGLAVALWGIASEWAQTGNDFRYRRQEWRRK